MADVPDELLGHWVHSHEEDSGGERVYRPADYDFPPARGRRGFELRPGGELVLYGPGATDRPEAATGRWSVSGTPRRARSNAAVRAARQLSVSSVSESSSPGWRTP